MVKEKLILCAVFVMINIILAAIDAKRIKDGKRIYHGINGLIYGGLVLLSYPFLHNIPAMFGMLFLRIPVFNTSLNLFRGLPYNYISKKTTSIIDKLTNGIVERVGYFNYCFIMVWIVWVFLCF